MNAEKRRKKNRHNTNSSNRKSRPCVHAMQSLADRRGDFSGPSTNIDRPATLPYCSLPIAITSRWHRDAMSGERNKITVPLNREGESAVVYILLSATRSRPAHMSSFDHDWITESTYGRRRLTVWGRPDDGGKWFEWWSCDFMTWIRSTGRHPRATPKPTPNISRNTAPTNAPAFSEEHTFSARQRPPIVI